MGNQHGVLTNEIIQWSKRNRCVHPHTSGTSLDPGSLMEPFPWPDHERIAGHVALTSVVLLVARWVVPQWVVRAGGRLHSAL